MDLAFVSGKMCGAEKQLSSPLFSELYSIARDKEALVSDYMDYSGTLMSHWNPSFFRAV
jgi:hypothetical protein